MKYNDFKKKVMNLPEWVKTDDDKLLYIRHLQYKMIQCERILEFIFGRLEQEINQDSIEMDNLYEKLRKDLKYDIEMENKIDPDLNSVFSVRM